MNLNKIQPKSGRKDLLLPIIKNCETFFKQTDRKAEETFEFKLTKPRETFHFNPPISIQRSWMIVLRSLEVYNSVFNITEENIKFELYTDILDKISLEV